MLAKLPEERRALPVRSTYNVAILLTKPPININRNKSEYCSAAYDI